MDVFNLPQNKNFNNYRNIQLQILAMLIKTILSTTNMGPMGSPLLGSIFLVQFEMLYEFQSNKTDFLEYVT